MFSRKVHVCVIKGMFDLNSTVKLNIDIPEGE